MPPPDDVHSSLFNRLVSLADSLVGGIDVIDVADGLVVSCMDFLPVQSVGIMLDDQRGNLRVLASSSEEVRLLELFELQNNEGPCLEAFASGALVSAIDLAAAKGRWPSFVPEAQAQGILAAYALPLQLNARTIGALNLFCSSQDAMTPEGLRIARMMATMATLGILNHWTVRRQERLAEQLQAALNSRIVIEQAKGVLAERSGVPMGVAFEMLRAAARTTRTQLSVVATEVAHGRASLDDLSNLRDLTNTPADDSTTEG